MIKDGGSWFSLTSSSGYIKSECLTLSSKANSFVSLNPRSFIPAIHVKPSTILDAFTHLVQVLKCGTIEPPLPYRKAKLKSDRYERGKYGDLTLRPAFTTRPASPFSSPLSTPPESFMPNNAFFRSTSTPLSYQGCIRVN